MYKFEEIMARGDDDDRTVRERLAGSSRPLRALCRARCSIPIRASR